MLTCRPQQALWDWEPPGALAGMILEFECWQGQQAAATCGKLLCIDCVQRYLRYVLRIWLLLESFHQVMWRTPAAERLCRMYLAVCLHHALARRPSNFCLRHVATCLILVLGMPSRLLLKSENAIRTASTSRCQEHSSYALVSATGSLQYMAFIEQLPVMRPLHGLRMSCC